MPICASKLHQRVELQFAIDTFMEVYLSSNMRSELPRNILCMVVKLIGVPVAISLYGAPLIIKFEEMSCDGSKSYS